MTEKPLNDVGYVKPGMQIRDMNGYTATIEAVNNYSGTVTINGQIFMWDWERLSDDVMVVVDHE